MTLQPQPHHRLSTCHRHPTKPITGFCAQCLRERLATIDPSTNPIPTLTPTLRRTKSYSSTTHPYANNNNNNLSAEPRRKSCDVRARNTLYDLFNLENQRKSQTSKPQIPQPELQLKQEEEEEEEQQEITEGFESEGEFKTMKEFIDLEWESKKQNTIRTSFWETASVFSKKLTKWQRKQKKNKEVINTSSSSNLVEIVNNKPNARRLRDTQSEIGRRSCDTDPRLSLDEFRYSFDDEPRASWDGYLNEKVVNYPRFMPLVSVIEDVNVNVNVNVDVDVDVDVDVKEGERSPGGSAQTRDYYGEALNMQRRRRSFDNRKDVVDEGKCISNAKVSPETVGLFHGAKLLVTEKELRDSNWYSIKDYKAESGESASSKDDGLVVAGGGGGGGGSQKGFSFKKSRRWRNVWNIWGLIQRRSGSKCGDNEGRCVGENEGDGGVLAESWQKLRRVANGDAGGGVSQKLIRSYSVSARNSYKMDALVHGKNNVEANIDGMKRREELLLQRNRSARYSPNNLDNGLLRFYLTPSRTFKKSKSGKSRLKNVHSIAGSVL